MQRLNLRSPKPFDFSNQADTINPRAKFYCVCEGPTEESYFVGVRNNKKELGIKNDVVIEIVEKEKGQETYSHPEQLVTACLFYMGRIDSDGNDIPEEEWEKHCKWDYKPGVDCVCAIFDRDYRQLERCLPDLLEKCRKHNVYVAISNPNFELWLLMHFPNIEQYDKADLLNNPKNLRRERFPEYSKDKKYLEIVLSIVAGGYSKGCKICFERFINGIPLAIKQAGMFCEEPEMLGTELGSSVGKLVKKMQERS